jgi:hypothetical protein
LCHAGPEQSVEVVIVEVEVSIAMRAAGDMLLVVEQAIVNVAATAAGRAAIWAVVHLRDDRVAGQDDAAARLAPALAGELKVGLDLVRRPSAVSTLVSPSLERVCRFIEKLGEVYKVLCYLHGASLSESELVIDQRGELLLW